MSQWRQRLAPLMRQGRQERFLEGSGFWQAALDGQGSSKRHDRFQQSRSGFVAQIAFTEQAGHLQFALCLLPVRSGFLALIDRAETA